MRDNGNIQYCLVRGNGNIQYCLVGDNGNIQYCLVGDNGESTQKAPLCTLFLKERIHVSTLTVISFLVLGGVDFECLADGL